MVAFCGGHYCESKRVRGKTDDLTSEFLKNLFLLPCFPREGKHGVVEGIATETSPRQPSGSEGSVSCHQYPESAGFVGLGPASKQ